MLHVVGRSDRRIFGLEPAERLRRQVGAEAALLIADADAVLDDAAVRWLLENPRQVLASPDGKPLAVVTEQGADPAEALSSGRLPVQTAAAIGERYIRKLRRKSPLLALSLEQTPVAEAERQLFDKVYKGVTDVVTKYVWPRPALGVTRAAAAAGITPNAVTLAGFVLMLIAGWLFFTGELAAGLIAAWGMTFLDTVDGKLARVTVTSSELGNLLDHGTDIIHPPLWWLCLGFGLATTVLELEPQIWIALWVILGCYIVGRAIELGFHLLFGFNAFLFRPFDSAFRTVVARRNIILLIMTVGVLIGRPAEAFVACAAWSAVSTVVQLVRIAQAWLQSRTAPLTPWMT